MLGAILHILKIYGSFCSKVLGLSVVVEKKRGRKNKKIKVPAVQIKSYC
jgi:hypothetical protein